MNYLFAFLGICLVIFVHELGHFLAARFCGVRVETFSIGMGPRVLSWKRGDTRYQVALLPLGGYVKMAGEELAAPGEEQHEATAPPRTPRPDELAAKSVGQRFLIFAGGVIMNIVFGLIVFPIVFFVGVPFEAPVIGATDPGSPAWQAGIEPGTTVLAIEGEEVRSFNDITTAIALGSAGPLELEVLEPGADEPRAVFVEPTYNEALGLRLLGVRQALHEDMKMSVAEGSPAAEAGVLDGDFLRDVEGAPPGYSLMRALIHAQANVLTPRLQVETPGVPDSLRWVELERGPPAADGRATIGVMPLHQELVAVRGDAERLGLQPGERITAVDGVPVLAEGDFARFMDAATGPVVLTVEGGEVPRTVSTADVPHLRPVDLIDDVYLVGHADSAHVLVVPGSPAERAGLATGDRIVRIGGTPVASWDEVASSIATLAGRPSRAAIELEVFHQAGPGQRIDTRSLTITPEPSPYSVPLGISVYPRQVSVQADSFGEALAMGVGSTWHFLEESWLFLKRVFSQDIAASNAGGIITIGAVSSHWAGEGLSKLFFFLALLSMNLAFLNLLPIPLLDGGHLFFLLIEKLKGSPVSARVQLASQGVGMVLLLSLMIYVTANDVIRWLLP